MLTPVPVIGMGVTVFEFNLQITAAALNMRCCNGKGVCRCTNGSPVYHDIRYMGGYCSALLYILPFEVQAHVVPASALLPEVRLYQGFYHLQ